MININLLSSFIFRFRKKDRQLITVIRVTWHMDDFGCLFSVVFSSRCKEMELQLWSKLHNKWITLIGFLELFYHFDAKTWSLYCDWNHMTNECYYLVFFDYFSFWHEDTKFILWSKWFDKWIVLTGSIQLFSHFDRKIRRSYRDQKYRTNENF